MVQFKPGSVPLPTPASAISIEPATWELIRDALARQGDHELRDATVVQSPAGVPIYVVVVERSAAEVPSAARLRTAFGMTQREAEVALLAAGRLSTAEMARTLGVTTHTVRRHMEQILAKLRLTRRLEVGPLLRSYAAKEREAAASAARSDEVRRARRLQVVAA